MKLDQLKSYIKQLDKVAVAYSGGLDSSFLLAVATDVLPPENVVAITVSAPSFASWELEASKELARVLGARQVIIEEQGIAEEIRFNPENRCYHCKKMEFTEIKGEAARLGIPNVLDGTNADDTSDYRPGMQALREVQSISPLLELGFTKQEIRDFAHEMGLPNWDKPANACLYSRIPYGREIKMEDLIKVSKAEKFLLDRGFARVRVRCHDDLARIEVSPGDRVRLLDDQLSLEIHRAFKKIGFMYITIDLTGYRMGSMNESILTYAGNK